jgi:cell division inhibitor SulA
MKNLNHTHAIFVKRALLIKTHSKGTRKWFMKTKRNSNVIYVIIQLSDMHTLEDTLNASMKNLNSTNVVFVTKALAKNQILKGMSNRCMKTPNLLNVVYVII